MDGTLVDTEPYWIAEEYLLVESFGGRWSHSDAEALVGGDLITSAEYIRDHGPVPLEPLEIVERMLAGVVRRVQERLPWRPGAQELLAALNSLRIPCALVTMSWASLAEAVLAALPAGSFQAVITGDQVTRGKPDPEPYVTAAAALKVPIALCVALEDSENGMRSAYSAGAQTIVIPNAAPVPHLAGVSRLETLSGLLPIDLLSVANTARGAESV